jgi:hypothetical protein
MSCHGCLLLIYIRFSVENIVAIVTQAKDKICTTPTPQELETSLLYCLLNLVRFYPMEWSRTLPLYTGFYSDLCVLSWAHFPTAMIETSIDGIGIFIFWGKAV